MFSFLIGEGRRYSSYKPFSSISSSYSVESFWRNSNTRHLDQSSSFKFTLQRTSSLMDTKLQTLVVKL